MGIRTGLCQDMGVNWYTGLHLDMWGEMHVRACRFISGHA